MYKPTVSIIIPIYNGENWIDSCFNSIINQTVVSLINLEIAVCDDASTDKTLSNLESWGKKLKKLSIPLKVFKNLSGKPKGVGYAKNRAIEISTGTYLCFQDVDDTMHPQRIQVQYELAKRNKSAIVGGRFKRVPENSTERFSRWANNLSSEQLRLQIYTSHGPTVIMPTWFCHRNVFLNVVGGFCENGQGTPEDLLFFYSHLDNKGEVLRTDEVVLNYTYHPEATTFSIKQETIFKIRLSRLINQVLCEWSNFTIWNAGKQGRHFYRALNNDLQNKVTALCDIDEKKIGQKYAPYDSHQRKVINSIPIIHFSEAVPPFVICVKLV
ncbi:UDP-GlcNAc:betaGal beta-1,3-N-acetylglucosaminyltransferase-like protein 1 [Trichogramma pretiosum]|uniref:UDP-GlcNAc:betaGal beta-1,3-N-acetylglucosaminyltransferase-like protein 1 n=1 Tax=Trichogramma pretiosum TaxID=7493 RepID=UPI0006C953FC|nr:UDP-GlcNAc:betaGal beta-1,3-N-acetylglucosaminyltransferase-like protein 1 [Trichogramma pretiosum]